MTDYISKAQVLETYAELYDAFDDNAKIREVLNAVYEKINGIKEHPEIVRCKDCRKNMMCEMTIHRPRDWFCGDGKRLDADD